MYGVVVKKIRLDKGLPLKSVYTEVCSKTNAIKFESGERTLAVDKFYQVLSNLMMTMDEFQWIKNGYRPQLDVYHSYRISKSWNANKIAQFEKYIRHIESSTIGIERIQLANYRLLENYEKGLKLNEQELSIVIDYFSNLLTWTLSDLKFFANNCYFLPYPLMGQLLKEALKVQSRYKYYPNSDHVFATVLINCIERMIKEKDVSNALSSLSILNDLITGITMDGYRLLAKYYEAKITFLYLDTEAGRESLEDLLKVANFFDNSQLAEEIEELLK
ncbi:hypothetical protein LQF61_01555 [Tetragenococcus koreensis]|nr:hypothetical protein [Tetragenococcus koreensis]MCF1584034.1 hypothetical protein [Tetragenococcus koreensis]MCF1613495.1 hypothetical protein [Tetragenococcus koreensis]MCF1618766.1 hypothetical protein [Tetragenococcus koreensis]MCF1623294.1 hypothetical protein [Tetragenococcus koreensis]MCF1628272.1 hypothetical protein [Tetragenococcus koreensis]